MGVENLPRTLEFGRQADDEGIERLWMSIVDQRRLPDECRVVGLYTFEAAIDAIQTLAVRGAPAIGVAGAGAIALWAVNQANCITREAYEKELHRVAEEVSAARPTAVNLSWGVNRVVRAMEAVIADGGAAAAAEAAAIVGAAEVAESAAFAPAAEAVREAPLDAEAVDGIFEEA